MRFYYHSFKDKKELRSRLKQATNANVHCSSIYEYAGIRHVILAIRDGDLALNICSYTDKPKTAIATLLNWGISEITNAIPFINYEMQAKPINNGCQLLFDGEYITRSFMPSTTDIMYVVNITPDSFSDGNKYANLEKYIADIEKALINGATVIDVGGESTHPDSKAIDSGTEILRLQDLIPQILSLKRKYDFKLSLDSYKAETVLHFIDSGIDIINDVSGRLTSNVLLAIHDAGLGYIATHSLTIPPKREICIDSTQNPVDVVYDWGYAKLDELARVGFAPEDVILDIGIGFGKTRAQQWYLLKNLQRFNDWPCELLLGHSRKGFLATITNALPSGRDLETAVIANIALVNCSIAYLRLHNLEMFNTVHSGFNQLHKIDYDDNR